MSQYAGNLTANGSLPASGTHPHGGGKGYVLASGDFDSGTLALEIYSAENETWVEVDGSDAALSADGMFAFVLPKCDLRLTLSGATSPDIEVYWM